MNKKDRLEAEAYLKTIESSEKWIWLKQGLITLLVIAVILLVLFDMWGGS